MPDFCMSLKRKKKKIHLYFNYSIGVSCSLFVQIHFLDANVKIQVLIIVNDKVELT